MSSKSSKETTLLISQKTPSNVPQLRFPLGLVSEPVRPYLELIRLEKPTGTILMFWPFAWGLTLAAYATSLPVESYGFDLLVCFVGAFILRSSACTVNDIFDREMDAGVERTKNRPMASGRISVPNACIYLSIQYAIGILFSFLTLQTGFPFYVALLQLLPIFAIYPLLKRVTYWPQAWLGFAMNFGLVTAWVAATGTLNVPLLCAGMSGCWCWTMLYDTIYACQDIRDDVKMGVRSTAILWGSWIRPLLVVCAFGFLAMLALVGVINGQGAPYFLVSVGGTAIHLLWQFMTVDLEVPASCWRNFNRNGHLGWIVWGGIAIDYFSRVGFLQIKL